MSDTPRTDDAEYLSYDSEPPESLEMVDVAFARQLERELYAANERIQRLEDIIRRASNEFFRDGSDSQTASGMLTILEEGRKP
jgi:hypothetical protein